MRLSKFLFIMVIITIVSVIYIQQQTFLLRLSYEIKNRERNLAELLDKNKILMYNILTLKAPSSLEGRLISKNVRLEMPQEWQVVNLPGVEAQREFIQAIPKAKNTLWGLIGFRSQAEAETQIVNHRD